MLRHLINQRHLLKTFSNGQNHSRPVTTTVLTWTSRRRNSSIYPKIPSQSEEPITREFTANRQLPLRLARSMSSATVSHNGSSSTSLTLNAKEQKLRQVLLDVAKYVDPEKPSELRFTGGWVRDKLLGMKSKDIDVAINDMTGYQFGLRMKEYLENPENASRYSDGRSDGSEALRSLHKIEANPEKSKHLETVTTRIFGLDIDLVNLRKETYTDESRNPQMEFGTPEEDALRRDATINALFFNLQTGLVEDLTGRGLKDMEACLIQTPLEPYQTFKDDPLRILRLIRFAARLGWRIDESTEAAMDDPSIRSALKAKISRERVGVEVEKMLRGPRPLMALQLLDRLGLYATVFCDPMRSDGFQPNVANWSKAYHCAQRITGGSETTLSRILAVDPDQKYVVWISACVAPWLDAPVPDQAQAAKRPPPPPAVSAIREGIKAPNKICDVILAAVQNTEDIRECKDAFLVARKAKRIQVEPSLRRESLGMKIRGWGPSWSSQVALVAIDEQMQNETHDRDILDEYGMFLEHLSDLDILSAYDEKAIVDGSTLAKALDLKPGPWMKGAMDTVIEYQLANPGKASRDDAIAAVSSKKGELTNRLLGHFLELTIRPMFAKAFLSKTTAAGHKRLDPLLRRPANSYETDKDDIPLRGNPSGRYVLDILLWCTSALNVTRTAQYWPVLVPPILRLLDDTDIDLRVRGCDAFKNLMDHTQPALLQRTGLGPVFQEALETSLSYLPSLTPESQSVRILDAAYAASLRLAEAMCESGIQSSRHKSEGKSLIKVIDEDFDDLGKPPSQALIIYLDGLMNDQIMPSLSHVAHNYPEVTITLLKALSDVLNRLGINSVSHLSVVVPQIDNILSNPLAHFSPRTLSQALKSLKDLLLNAWPRVDGWRFQLYASLSRCWILLAEEYPCDDEPWSSLKEEMREAVDLIYVCTTKSTSHIDIRKEADAIISSDSRLQLLFQTEGIL